MARLVDDLLDVSRIAQRQAGRSARQRWTCRRWWSSAVETSRPLIEAGGTGWPSAAAGAGLRSTPTRPGSPRCSSTC